MIQDGRYALRQLGKNPGFTAVAAVTLALGGGGRVHEIGIRIALGATRINAIRMAPGNALSMVCIGLAVGAPIAFWGERFAASLAPELQIRGAVPIALGAAGLIVIARPAAYIPARRAGKADPREALRYE